MSENVNFKCKYYKETGFSFDINCDCLACYYYKIGYFHPLSKFNKDEYKGMTIANYPPMYFTKKP